MSEFTGNFRIWLESNNDQKYIFCDLDDTLIHRIDNWIGGQSSKRGKLIKMGDTRQDVYERPHAKDFLSEAGKVSNLYILTDAEESHAKSIVKSLGYDRFIKECLVMRNLSPNELGERFQLQDHQWFLVDNMPLKSIETANKMSVLGAKSSLEHFIKIDSWYPTDDKLSDNSLLQVLKTIKHRFLKCKDCDV